MSTRIEELPTWESRRAFRIRQGHDLYRGRNDTNRCHAQKLLGGILHKNIGQPWHSALSEIQRKVSHHPGERTEEKLRGAVAHETWVEDGVILTYGRDGKPIPAEQASWQFHFAYYVDPTTGRLACVQRQTFHPEFRVPFELPLNGPFEKAVRIDNIWYRVFFTADQIAFLKQHPFRDDSNTVAETIWGVLRKETRKVTVKRKTHRNHKPQFWHWPELINSWETTLQRHLGKNEEEVLTALEKLGQPTRCGYDGRRATGSFTESVGRWISNATLLSEAEEPRKIPTWTPYHFVKGLLEINPDMDTITETISVKPKVEQLGGKPLRRLKARIEGLRQHTA